MDTTIPYLKCPSSPRLDLQARNCARLPQIDSFCVKLNRGEIPDAQAALTQWRELLGTMRLASVYEAFGSYLSLSREMEFLAQVPPDTFEYNKSVYEGLPEPRDPFANLKKL